MCSSSSTTPSMNVACWSKPRRVSGKAILSGLRNCDCSIPFPFPQGRPRVLQPRYRLVVCFQKAHPPRIVRRIPEPGDFRAVHPDIAGPVAQQVVADGLEDRVIRIPAVIPLPEMQVDPARWRKDMEFVVRIYIGGVAGRIKLVIGRRVLPEPDKDRLLQERRLFSGDQ